MAIYAAQIDCMDQGIGKVLAILEKLNALDDTVLLFLSDNGATHEWVSRAETNLANLGTDRSYETYGKPWANASNTPFRLYKHWVHEGGISTPFIVHWPSGVPQGNQVFPQVGHVIDLMPTCLELAGASYPSGLDGNPIPPMEGTSLVRAFGGASFQREPVFWEHESNRAVRDGNWKLAAQGIDGPWELYDLAADRTELHDLSGKDPDLVKRLAAAWNDWAERCQVFPLDDRKWLDRLKTAV
jgi:arylsulfatase